MKPGSEEALDVLAASRLFQASADLLSLEHREGRHGLDAEALRELGARVAVDPVELERAVVPAALQHLGQESLHAAAAPGRGIEEEDEAGLL